MTVIPAPLVRLNSGHQIPQLGFGVFQVDPDETERVVSAALEAGYRHIDTAMIYRNEVAVGRAIASSGIPRDELFITTKLFREDHGYATARQALPLSLERLGLDYLDLYLIHWPAPARGVYVESWRAFEEMSGEGLVRSIGVCNFLPEHLEKLLSETTVVPSVNQIELHPAFQQRDLRAFHEPLGIKTEAWAPLGQAQYALDGLSGMNDITKRHAKTPAQIVIRWHLQEGLIVFPKTVNKDRMRENANVFDFELSSYEMATIASWDRGLRVGAHPRDRN